MEATTAQCPNKATNETEINTKCAQNPKERRKTGESISGIEERTSKGFVKTKQNRPVAQHWRGPEFDPQRGWGCPL